jgi:hypothetical protein
VFAGLKHHAEGLQQDMENGGLTKKDGDVITKIWINIG